MNKLSDLEFMILDECYFVSSWKTIRENLSSVNDADFEVALIGLLHKKYITQLKYRDDWKDFEKMEKPDVSLLLQSSFVASKEGLFIHNSRN